MLKVTDLKAALGSYLVEVAAVCATGAMALVIGHCPHDEILIDAARYNQLRGDLKADMVLLSYGSWQRRSSRSARATALHPLQAESVQTRLEQQLLLLAKRPSLPGFARPP